MRSMKMGVRLFILSFAGIAILGMTILAAQQSEPSASVETKDWTTQQDHQNMMEQLGIIKLRPGPSGREDAPNPANYDESLANPFPKLPDPLKLKNGKKVTSARMWWEQRRPEIVEDFEREVLGCVPPGVPKVTWKVTDTKEAKVGSYPVLGKQLVGHVDNSSISYGIPEKGDAKWLDQKGSFMAAVAAGPVFRLLGAKDLGTGDDYNSVEMPPVNAGLLDGRLAWRQHDGGHTDGPNWRYFIPWADKFLKH